MIALIFRRKIILDFFLLSLFILLPFQRRFHGCVDSWSRKLTLPDFPLPEFFSKKIHLFITDIFILFLALILLFRFKVSLRQFFWEGPSKYLTLFFVTALISLFFSITGHYALQYLRLFQFSLIFLFFNAICAARREIDFPSFIHRLAWILLLISCIQCAIGIYQYFSQHALGLSFLGELDMRHFPFHNPGKHRWLFDKFLPTSHSSEFLYRASGTFSHPNILGGFLFCSVLASFYLFMKTEGKRLLLIGVIALQIFTLYIVFSRSAIIALVLATLIWGWLQLREIIKRDGIRSPQFRRFSILASTIIISGLIGIAIFHSQLTARGGIINYNAVTNYADSERVQYLKMAVDMVKEHPLFGIGFNNFQLYEDPIQPGYPGHVFYSKVHNIYLLIASEMGLVSCGLFLLFIFSLLKRSWRKGSTSPEKMFLLSVFWGLLFIGGCDFYLLHTPHGRILFFGFAALLYGVHD
ncbi:MAG: O-antigen ligase family protein [Rhabdochlamydiaceae bacterium]